MRSDAAETRRPSSRSTVHHERGHAAIFSPNDANWVAPATKTAAKRHETNTCGLVQAFEEQQANASPALQRRTPERTNRTRMTDAVGKERAERGDSIRHPGAIGPDSRQHRTTHDH